MAWRGDFEPVEMKFDEIIPAVKRGDVDAGLLIHEGRITYETHGLVKILDLWEWWYDKTSLPLPLGLNAIRRDIPVEQQRAFLKAMRASIDYALRNADEAIECAMKYSSSKKKLAKKFALMYVNDYTYEMPESVVRGLEALYSMAERKRAVQKATSRYTLPL